MEGANWTEALRPEPIGASEYRGYRDWAERARWRGQESLSEVTGWGRVRRERGPCKDSGFSWARNGLWSALWKASFQPPQQQALEGWGWSRETSKKWCIASGHRGQCCRGREKVTGGVLTNAKGKSQTPPWWAPGGWVPLAPEYPGRLSLGGKSHWPVTPPTGYSSSGRNSSSILVGLTWSRPILFSCLVPSVSPADPDTRVVRQTNTQVTLHGLFLYPESRFTACTGSCWTGCWALESGAQALVCSSRLGSLSGTPWWT